MIRDIALLRRLLLVPQGSRRIQGSPFFLGVILRYRQKNRTYYQFWGDTKPSSEGIIQRGSPDKSPTMTKNTSREAGNKRKRLLANRGHYFRH